ncbi:MAG: crossover junction endodeoxyribonuclease RuvC [Anaerolineae bacterium]|nr:crossover junction endodeoxyribonuclease RuvC [Anaerolineae bacterium]MDW8098375.1 crossover junction endodeoxyribonuclease RuvC [Anaerolineae bacterium]
MVVLGVDPGTAITGYGVVRADGDRLSLMAYGAITTSPSQSLPERLLAIHHLLLTLIESYQPQAMAVEEVFFGRNVRTAIAVGHARGVVLLAAAQTGLPVFTYTPTAVKQAIVGYGRADKHQVQEMIRMLLALSEVPQPDDVADAVAIAICHIYTSQLNRWIAAADTKHST